VYAYDTVSKIVSFAADGFVKPNGVAFSPDHKTAYVTDTGMADVSGEGREGSDGLVAARRQRMLQQLAVALDLPALLRFVCPSCPTVLPVPCGLLRPHHSCKQRHAVNADAGNFTLLRQCTHTLL
jgi:hypothetical protein